MKSKLNKKTQSTGANEVIKALINNNIKEVFVYPGGTTVATDAPLLAALKTLLGENHFLYNLLISVGLLGLVASFHGIILAAGRATFEFGRVGYAPRILGKTHKRFRTPAFALIVNMLIGIIAIMTGKTADIITIACFGAVGLYIISMISFFKLRKNEPNMHRPFKVPFYPLFPILALVISSIAMVALIVHNLALAGIFFGILILSMLWFNFFVSDEIKQEALKWKMG